MHAAKHETGTRNESKKKVITVDDVRGDSASKHMGPPGPPPGVSGVKG